MLVINERLSVPLSELDLSYAKSSGPGGQHANKTNSKAILFFSLAQNQTLPADVKKRFRERYKNRISGNDVFILASDSYRDQRRNAKECLERFKAMILEVAKPPKKRQATKPSRAAKQRRLNEKKKQGDKKKLRQKISD